MGLGFLSFGFGEMLIVGLAALLIFGGRLPEVMRNLGRAYAKFRHGMNEVAEPLRQEMRRIDVRAPQSAVPRRTPANQGDPSVDARAPRPETSDVPETVPDDGRGDLPPYRPDLDRPGSGGAADEPPPV